MTREGLHIEVLRLETKAERYAWIKNNVRKLPGSGIIYCLTQRDCQHISKFLSANGISARPYYSNDELEKVNEETGKSYNDETEELFYTNKIKVIVATIKLGMGYDKEDIGFIIHFQRPGSLVAYYQQIGRAGRKTGMDAFCYLLTGKEDRTISEYFIETAFPTEKQERNGSYAVVYLPDIIKEKVREPLFQQNLIKGNLLVYSQISPYKVKIFPHKLRIKMLIPH